MAAALDRLAHACPTLGAERRSGRRSAARPPSVNFDAGAFAGSYNEFIADSSPRTRMRSSAQRATWTGGAELPARTFCRSGRGASTCTAISCARSSRATVRGSGEDRIAFDRDSHSLGRRHQLATGRRLVRLAAGLRARSSTCSSATLFEELQQRSALLQDARALAFLAANGAVYDGSIRLVRYSNETAQPDGETIESQVGVNGLITYHFAALAMGGWAASFYEDARHRPRARSRCANYDDFVAHAEVKWFLDAAAHASRPRPLPSACSTIALGYVQKLLDRAISVRFYTAATAAT